MSAAKRNDSKLVIGGEPRADLLPPEIKAEGKAHRQRRTLVLALVLVLVLASGGYVLATARATGAQDALTAELARTDGLLLEKGNYIEVSRLSDQVATAQMARIAATSTEIDWSEYLASATALLPSTMTLVSATVTSATPTVPFAQAEGPLRPSRVAQIVFTTRSTSVPDTAGWLESQKSLVGYVDAAVGSVTTDSALTTTLTLHIDERAYWNRFAAAPESDAATEEQE